jgi:hypothetical protein
MAIKDLVCASATCRHKAACLLTTAAEPFG